MHPWLEVEVQVEWEVVKDEACCACAKNAARTVNDSLNEISKTRIRTVVIYVPFSRNHSP